MRPAVFFYVHTFFFNKIAVFDALRCITFIFKVRYHSFMTFLRVKLLEFSTWMFLCNTLQGGLWYRQSVIFALQLCACVCVCIEWPPCSGFLNISRMHFGVRERPEMKTTVSLTLSIFMKEMINVSKSCSARNDHTAVCLFALNRICS